MNHFSAIAPLRVARAGPGPFRCVDRAPAPGGVVFTVDRAPAPPVVTLLYQGGGGARLTGHIQIEGNEDQLRQTINNIEQRSAQQLIV